MTMYYKVLYICLFNILGQPAFRLFFGTDVDLEDVHSFFLLLSLLLNCCLCCLVP